MLFTAADIPGGLENGLLAWLDVWNEISPAFGPVIARYRAPFSYADDRFHSAAAALESYSSLRHGKRAIEKAERDRRLGVVRDSLDATDPTITEWVLEALKQAHYYTLKSRLERLLDEAGPVGATLVGDDAAGFVKAVVRARDAYAHSQAIAGGIKGGPALAWTAIGLNWLLRYHALREIGFAPEDAQNRVLESNAFKQEAQLLREALTGS